MSELARIQAGNTGLQLTNVEDMRTVSQIILQSCLAPDSYKTKEQIFVGLQSGAEIGLKPMQALNSIVVIHGKPTLWGDAALGLVKRSGLMKAFAEKVTGEGENMVAYVKSIRKDGDCESTVETEFSVKDAKTAKLWGKSGPWTTHPKRMLKYKARAFNLRDNFPDILMGMHLTEEMQGEDTLEKPQCDTKPRAERRKKIESQEVVMETEPVADTDGSMEAGAYGYYDVVLDKFAKAKGHEHGFEYFDEADFLELEKEFFKFAVYVLCVDDDDIMGKSDFTDERLSRIEKHIETDGVPE